MSQYVCLLLVLGGDPNCGDYFHFVRQFQNYLIICEVGLKRNKVAITSKCVWLWGSDDIWPSPISHNSHYDWNALFHEHFVWKASILLKRKELFEARQNPRDGISKLAANDELWEHLLIGDAATLTFDVALTKSEAVERGCQDRGCV